MVPIWTSGPSCCAPSSSCKRHLPTLRESAPLVSGITHRKSKMLRARKQRNNLYPILKLQKFHRGIWNSGSSCSDTFQSAITQGRLLNYPCHILWTSGQLPTRNISLNISRDSSDEQKLRFKTKGNIKHWKRNNMKQHTHPLRGGTPCNWNISRGTPPFRFSTQCAHQLAGSRTSLDAAGCSCKLGINRKTIPVGI